jgi:hypothetical protein
MKKILITLTLILPLFLFNNLLAQSNGAPNFYVLVHVNAPSQCPTTGAVNGDTPEIGHESTTYNGPGATYWLVWSNTLTYAQPVTVEVKTDKDANGYWCYDQKTEILSGADWGYNFYMNLELIAPNGGNVQ